MGARILVVDDDPTIVRLVSMLLELEDFEVETASNGREALQRVSAFQPDLVVCDVMMPILNGLEVLSRLRRDPSTEDLPIIMLSAKAQEIDVQHGKGAGATDYVTKPFDPDTLVATVRRVLEAEGVRSAGSAQRSGGKKAKAPAKRPAKGPKKTR